MSSSSSGSNTTSSYIQSLSEIGISFEASAKTTHVIHTSSIPLASVINSSRVHPWSKMNRIEHHCSIHCAHQPGEWTHNECPCKDIDAYHICFLEATQRLGYNLNNSEAKVDPTTFAFCQDGRTIFDSRYSAFLRGEIGRDGWDSIQPKDLRILCNNLYWFRVEDKKRRGKLSRLLIKPDHMTDLEFLAAFKQCIFTLNGLIIKRVLCFPDFIGTYDEIAEQTANLFIDLFRDYIAPNSVGDEGVFLEIKKYLQHVKRTFHFEHFIDRHNSLIEYNFKTRSLKMFFPEIQKLFDFIIDHWNRYEEDYTSSPTWFYRMTTFHQTRILGYLPKHESFLKAVKYRDYLNLDEEPRDGEHLKLVYHLVLDELNFEKVPKGLLNSDSSENFNRTTEQRKTVQDFIKDLTSDVEFIIKPNASVNQSVKDGGKMEDARRYLQLIMKNDWQIPIRNLDTHEIIKFIHAENDQFINYHDLLFWFAYQNMLNELIERREWKRPDDLYQFYNPDGDPWKDKTLFKARIAVIKEPGKDRLLTMSNSLYTWSLTPAGKMLNSVIAMIPSHEVGLKGANDDWIFNQKLSSGTKESDFIYNLDGSVKKIFAGFEDWKEATDNIHRQDGIIMVKALMDHSSFPLLYGRFVLAVIAQHQSASQNIIISEEGKERDIVHWSGFIKRGFMMGNPITKTILHSCHIVQTAGMRRTLGIKLQAQFPIGAPNRRHDINRLNVRNPKIQNLE